MPYKIHLSFFEAATKKIDEGKTLDKHLVKTLDKHPNIWTIEIKHEFASQHDSWLVVYSNLVLTDHMGGMVSIIVDCPL